MDFVVSIEANIQAWIIEKANLIEDISFKVQDKIATLANAVADKASAAAKYVLSGALWENVSAWIAGKAEIIASTAATMRKK